MKGIRPSAVLPALLAFTALVFTGAAQAATFTQAIPVGGCSASVGTGCVTDFRGTGDLHLLRSSSDGTGMESRYPTMSYSAAAP